MIPTLPDLRRAIDLIAIPVTILDLRGRIEHVNPPNERLLGRSATDLHGRSIAEILPPAYQDQTAALLEDLLHRGRLHAVFPNLRADGTTVLVEITAELVRSGTGEPRWIIATVGDLGHVIDLLEQLSASALRLVSPPDGDFLLTVIHAARALLGARYAALGVVEDGRLVRFIPDGLTEAEIARIDHWPDGHGLIGEMISGRRTIRLADLGADPRAAGFPAGHPPMRSFLGTPIHLEGSVFGHLYLTDKVGASEFSLIDERLAELFAAQAAVAIRDDRRRRALEASERSLAEAQRVAHIGSWEWDVGTGRLQWSDEAHRIAGIEPGTFGGTLEDFLAVVHPEDRARVASSPQEPLEGDPPSIDYRIVRADGAVRSVHEESIVVRDPTGRPIRNVGTTQDVTDRLAAEVAQQRLARLVEGISSEIYVFEAATLRFTEGNAGALRNIGYGLEELRTLTPLDLKPDLSAEQFGALLAPLRSGEREQVAFETFHRRKDGSRYPVEVRVHLLPAEAPPVFVAIVQDVTERVARDEELARLASAVEQAADSVMLMDVKGRITYVNPSFSRLYGFGAEAAIGSATAFLNSGRHSAEFWTELWDAVSSGLTWTGSITNRRIDGSLVDVESVVSPVRDPGGRIMAYVQADRDVTRERALEGALERDARERETIEAALARIDPADSPETIAGAACEEIARLSGVDAAWVTELDQGRARLLATDPLTSQVIRPGVTVPRARARTLAERAAAGPWTEGGTLARPSGLFEERIASMGLRARAYAPLKGAHGLLGVVGIGARDPSDADRLLQRLPALATFGSIVGALVAPGLEVRRREDEARSAIRAIVDTRAFHPVFQPILDLRTGVLEGFEALSRFDDGRRPDVVFAVAAQTGLGIELETATLRAAVGAASAMPEGAYLSVNLSPGLVNSGVLPEVLSGLRRTIVVEITEHEVIDDYVALRRGLAALGPSVHLAVDDAGAGYASLRHILELRPDFVKLDVGLVRGIDDDPARQALIAGIEYFAVKSGVRLIAEGIETSAELETLRGLGVALGQGFLLGHPTDPRPSGDWPRSVDLPH